LARSLKGSRLLCHARSQRLKAEPRQVITVVIFIILGIVVNAGGNSGYGYIGGHNWHIGDAPFVGGFGGFASVFVTAAFAYGGTESLAITAGEQKNPSKTLPRVVKLVFWRYVRQLATVPSGD
jgi:AAT family amino acid transporter